LDCCIWGDRYQLGMALWTAHELTKFGPNGLASVAGQPGIGIPQSKSVDSVSVSYDTTVGSEGEAAGQYNTTIYGRQFWSMMKLLPIGPIQVGAATMPMYPVQGAWPGPYPFPAPGGTGFSS
jgi:hypothetical protein